MRYDFSPFTAKTRAARDWLAQEFAGLRTGRASPAILDLVQVEAWGSRMPIKHTAQISVEDAHTLRVVPHDQEQTKAIEKAIATADLGLSVAAGEGGMRVIFPQLSAERREALIKSARGRLEEARVSLRRARDETLREIDAKEKNKILGKDDAFRAKKELEVHMEKEQGVLAEMLAHKEKEINQ
jgi:ribosome recycling factor